MIWFTQGLDGMTDTIRASRGGPELYDRIATIRFESGEATEAAAQRPGAAQVAAEMLQDEWRFIKFSM